MYISKLVALYDIPGMPTGASDPMKISGMSMYLAQPMA